MTLEETVGKIHYVALLGAYPSWSLFGVKSDQVPLVSASDGQIDNNIGECPKLGDKPSWVKLGADFFELCEAMLCREIFHIFGQNPTLVTKISGAWILIRQKEAVYMVSLQRRDMARLSNKNWESPCC
jgi:hypothetical protein